MIRMFNKRYRSTAALLPAHLIQKLKYYQLHLEQTFEVFCIHSFLSPCSRYAEYNSHNRGGLELCTQFVFEVPQRSIDLHTVFPRSTAQTKKKNFIQHALVIEARLHKNTHSHTRGTQCLHCIASFGAPREMYDGNYVYTKRHGIHEYNM